MEGMSMSMSPLLAPTRADAGARVALCVIVGCIRSVDPCEVHLRLQRLLVGTAAVGVVRDAAEDWCVR
jgi:hypothetical protein